MKKRKAKSLPLLITAVMTVSGLFGTWVPVQAADDGWIGGGELSDNGTAAPGPDEVLPSKNQYDYQKDELAAFCHFSPNTFKEIKWGENYGSRDCTSEGMRRGECSRASASFSKCI